MSLLSRSIGRQIGLMIDRKGRVEMVLVGEQGSIFIPKLSRSHSRQSRLSGLRLLHTHLNSAGISQEDLMDMLFLRLDAIIVLTVSPEGMPLKWQSAHLLPLVKTDTPYHVSVLHDWDQTSAEFTLTADALDAEILRETSDSQVSESGQRALVVSVGTDAHDVQARCLDELAELARTAGLNVVGKMVQRLRQINPQFILGRGKMAELEVEALQGNADLLLFDGELSPAQLNNLAEITERKVIDRTQLILDIFAQHAASKAGKLQVELAQLRYMQPRLVGKNRAMDRLMGGIGGRGPGETRLETDRRKTKERISFVRKELDQLRRQRSLVRERRSRDGIPLASLVGYTNAGKSTLLNRLTKSNVLTQNKLFATLDPTTRRLRFPKAKELILADTVGFIRNLPKELFDAFLATLEELEAAKFLVHVADATHADLQLQIEAVENILEDMDLARIPRVLVLNKWDAVSIKDRINLASMMPNAIPISANTGYGLDNLLEILEINLLSN